MQRYEYKVVPAPLKGEKARGAKTLADRFALTLTQLMNELGRDGWEYQRSDTLPCEERVGFTGKSTSFQNMLVFRRALEAAATAPRVTEPVAAASVAAPVMAAPVAAPVAAPAADPVPAFFRRDEEPTPAALSATLTARPSDAEPPRTPAPAVEAPLGAAPSLGPARGNGVAAE